MAEVNISDAEWDVMEVVWRLEKATAAEAITELAHAKDWNHRTVRTLLSRLVDKGALSAKSDGNRYIYRPAISRARSVHQQTRSFLDKVFGGDVGSLLAHFARDPQVSADDLAELRKLLDERLNEKPS